MGLLSKAASKDSFPIQDAPGAAQDDIRTWLEKQVSAAAYSGGVFLDSPEANGGKASAESAQRIGGMVQSVGSAYVLPSGRSLILFSQPIDIELAAHRLSKTLNSRALVLIEGADLEHALDLINPYM
ncbi:hypothetical protein LJC14_07045 [Treponema sp. OttesenSCG-928-L16]|nr:hypothetical protein [Treponema sp. OttesenSCG-928-L16]